MARMTGGEALVQSLYAKACGWSSGCPACSSTASWPPCATSRGSASSPRATSRPPATWPTATRARAAASAPPWWCPAPGCSTPPSGLSTAYSASSPVLMISGQIPRDQHRQEHRRSCTRSTTSSTASARSPSGAGACSRWRTCRPRCARRCASSRAAGRARSRSRCRPRPWRTRATGRAAAARRGGARTPRPRATSTAPPSCCWPRARPLIYAGGGVHLSGAHDALAAVAEHLQAGVVQSAEGKGAVSDHNDALARAPPSGATPRCAPTSTRRTWCSRWAAAWPGSPSSRAPASSRSTRTQQEIGRNHQDTLGLVGDARATLEALLERPARGVRRRGPRARPSTRRCARRSRPRTRWSPTPRSSSRCARERPRTRSSSRA